ncbi:MAG: alpha/beta fold hydrolase [Gemmataceae bacterium]|nr:alpha/beta fold hydrolase [Gemmataceae bacterium]
MNRVLLLASITLLLSLPSAARAQAERFEVGQRLRAFEAAWEDQKDEAPRKRALGPLADVTALFFKGSIDEVGRVLDRARHALRSEQPAPAEVQWAESLSVRLATRFLDLGAAKLPITLQPFYEVKAEAPKSAVLRLILEAPAAKALPLRHEQAIEALPLETALPLAGKQLAEGDYQLRAEIVLGEKVLATVPAQTVSFAGKQAERVKALQTEAADLPAEAPPVERATVRAQAALLRELAGGATLETNYPAARLLVEAEAAVKAAQGGKGYYGARPGQFWLRLPDDRSNMAVRVLAPETVKQGKPLPLVIALHGAGGSENLFFEGYGSGEIVRQCAQRGWLLVAPRSEGFRFNLPAADLIDRVAKLYPVDRKRVFVVGHSMGAMQAVSAAQAAPERYAAVAALGGGGFVGKQADGLKALPFFVGVGGKDFALTMARSLRDGLKRVGVERLEFREYAEVEHLMIVRVALPEVFAFFDKAGR